MTDDSTLTIGGADAGLQARLDAELTAFNLSATGATSIDDFSVQIRDPDGALVAGLTGWVWGDCGGVSMIWVREDQRGRGAGSRLLAAAEREAAHRGCDRIILSSFTFQTPEFYHRNGYTETGRWPGFPAGAADVHFCKPLTESR